MSGWINKCKVLFYGPGWEPGKPRTGDINDIPEIENPIIKYDVPLPVWLKVYVLLQAWAFVTIFSAVTLYAGGKKTIGLFSMSLFMYGMVSISCIGRIFDQSKWSHVYEFVRLLSLMVIDQVFCSEKFETIDALIPVPLWTCRLWYQTSLFIWIVMNMIQFSRGPNYLDKVQLFLTAIRLKITT